MEKKKLDYIIDVPKKVNNIFFLMHGFASNSEKMILIATSLRKILPTSVLVSVNGPFKADIGGGCQWFSLKATNVDDIAKKIKYSYYLLNDLIDEKLKEFSLNDKNLILAGFSQGAMMALYTGFRRKEKPMAVLSFSGLLPETVETLSNELVSRPDVLLLHGTDDRTIPAESMRYAETLLREFNIPYESHLIPNMDHNVDEVAIEYAKKFLMNICNKVEE